MKIIKKKSSEAEDDDVIFDTIIDEIVEVEPDIIVVDIGEVIE